MGPVYSSGINGGLQEKLASAADLVTLNMVLDHSRINLPLTNKANDAHPKRCPLEEIHLSISFHLFDSLLVSSPAPILMFLLSYLLLFSVCLFTLTFTDKFFIPLNILPYTTHSCCPSILSFLPGPPQSSDPEAEEPTGAALGVRPGQWTQRGRGLRRRWQSKLKEEGKKRAKRGEQEQNRGESRDEEEEKGEYEARKRSGIEATKGVRRIGSREKDWWWTKNPEESLSGEDRKRKRRATFEWINTLPASGAATFWD